MKILGIPIIHILIAVGILGLVTYSYFSYVPSALKSDDTLHCQRSYDFSQVKFTPEAKQDWDKCYMPEPLYRRDHNNFAICVQYPEESCVRCAEALALKYNNSDYCNIMQPCGIKANIDDNINVLIRSCNRAVNQIKTDNCTIIRNYADVNFSLIKERVRIIYPSIDEKTEELRKTLSSC